PRWGGLSGRRDTRPILARDEQAAAFMADGLARATGQPGVCLAVCGPGVYNAATPLATAHSDSVPVLLISGQVPPSPHGPRSGYYHENNELAPCAHFPKGRVAVDEPGQLLPSFDRAWMTLTEGRPGPVLFDVPGEVLRAEVGEEPPPAPPTTAAPRMPKSAEIESLARL